jgi:hypothetical protein
MNGSTQTQTVANHARYVPGFHFVTGTLNIVLLVWSLYRLATQPVSANAFGVVVAIVLLAQFIYLRQFPLKVQDHLIRLEERLRLERLLPTEMRGWADNLTSEQLIALRFASDEELPTLAKRVVDERIAKRAAIKALVRQWRPDHMRA